MSTTTSASRTENIRTASTSLAWCPSIWCDLAGLRGLKARIAPLGPPPKQSGGRLPSDAYELVAFGAPLPKERGWGRSPPARPPLVPPSGQ
jgi:hypothetical protein